MKRSNIGRPPSYAGSFHNEDPEIFILDNPYSRCNISSAIIIGNDIINLGGTVVDPINHEQAAQAAKDIDLKSPVFQGVIRGMLPWLLLSVLQEGPIHALSMIKAISERTHGLWKPSPGSVYPSLHRFEKEGLLESEWQENKAAPRRVYRLTKKGGQEVPMMRQRLIEELTKAQYLIEKHIQALQDWGEMQGDHGKRSQ